MFVLKLFLAGFVLCFILHLLLFRVVMGTMCVTKESSPESSQILILFPMYSLDSLSPLARSRIDHVDNVTVTTILIIKVQLQDLLYLRLF